jgi:hypothetical protein
MLLSALAVLPKSLNRGGNGKDLTSWTRNHWVQEKWYVSNKGTCLKATPQ